MVSLSLGINVSVCSPLDNCCFPVINGIPVSSSVVGYLSFSTVYVIVLFELRDWPFNSIVSEPAPISYIYAAWTATLSPTSKSIPSPNSFVNNAGF